MTDDQLGLLAAAEGTTAEIAWVVVYVLCCVVMVAPFVIWFAGVRTPRAERRRPTPDDESTVLDADGAPADREEVDARDDQPRRRSA